MVRYILVLFGLGVTITGFYVFGLKSPIKKEELLVSDVSQTDPGVMAEWPDEVFIESKTVVASEIGRMSLSEIDQELKNGREKIKHERLIEKLNNGEASLKEVNQAKVLFERLALLSLENAHRKAQKLAPEIESGLDKIGQDLEEIKDMLRY